MFLMVFHISRIEILAKLPYWAFGCASCAVFRRELREGKKGRKSSPYMPVRRTIWGDGRRFRGRFDDLGMYGQESGACGM
jgi:hypothetical protein